MTLIKSGSYISDIFEKKGKIYILYGHKSGFTFDEEWLYVIDTNDFDTTQSFHGQAINAKPITPQQAALNSGEAITDLILSIIFIFSYHKYYEQN